MLDEIEAFLERHADVRENGQLDDGGLIEGIARKGQISTDTIITWLGQRRVQSIDFDTADRIMLYVHGYMWAHEPQFEEYYLAVNLNVTKCACPGCETMIEVVQRTKSGGAVVAKYCSQTCRSVAYQIRKGEKHMRRKHHLDGKETKCRKGHKRTPENSKRRKDGRIECMVCAREHMRAFRARRKAALAA